MKKYNGNWKILEGPLRIERLQKLPECLEKEHLFKITQMLRNENFDPESFYLHEYPIEGVYMCCQINQNNYFSIQETEGDLIPHYTTEKLNEQGLNTFPCTSIRESIQKMEC